MNRIETNELQRDRARDSERPGQPQHPSCVSWSQEPSFESLEVNGLNIMPEVCNGETVTLRIRFVTLGPSLCLVAPLLFLGFNLQHEINSKSF